MPLQINYTAAIPRAIWITTGVLFLVATVHWKEDLQESTMHGPSRRFRPRYQEHTNNMTLNFAVAGFPKCGTTFLMQRLANVSGVYLGNPANNLSEVHDLRFGDIDTFQARYATEHSGINGFKSPEVLLSEDFLTNLETYFPNVDFVVSLRHPVHYFQSLYNFKSRRFSSSEKYLDPNLLIGNCGHACEEGREHRKCLRHAGYMNVCTGTAHFHRFLARLGMTRNVTTSTMNTSTNENKDSPLTAGKRDRLLELNDNDDDEDYTYPVHTGFKGRVFLLHLEQMADANLTRRNQLEEGISRFLGLPNRLQLASSEEEEKPKAFHLLDICQDEYRHLRHVLVDIGRQASQWILSSFLSSNRVVVSNRHHFEQILETWGKDPCLL